MSRLAILKLGAALALALCLSGCENSARIEISHSGGDLARGNLVFNVKKSRWWTSGRPCFYKIDVIRPSASQLDDQWNISSGMRCVPLNRVVCGVLPEGFQTDVPAKTIVDGEAYTIIAHGDGWLGEARFKRQGDAYVAIDK